MWSIKYFLLAVLLFCSCSSLPVALSPDTPIAVEKYSPSESLPANTSKTIADLKQELLNLKLVFSILKSNSTNLSSLSDQFEKRLLALQEELKQARQESSELLASLETLKKDFEAYRAEVRRNKLRAILVAGGVGAAVGVCAGIAIHHYLSK